MSVHLPVALPCHDDLSRLARDDPTAFEELRRQLIESFIDNASETTKPRLRGIQFRIECLRRISHSALGATVRIYELMWKSFLELNCNCQEFVETESRLLSGKHFAAAKGDVPAGDAQILEFRPRPPGKGKRPID